VESKVPCLKQLIKIYQNNQKPVIALHRVPKEKISFYGIARVQKKSRKLYRIREIKEKPSLREAPSNLAVTGKSIITPDVFKALEKSPTAKGEIKLAGAFNKMAEEGKEILGYDFEGKWLECGNKLDYFKSNLYLCLKDPKFKMKAKEIMKEV